MYSIAILYSNTNKHALKDLKSVWSRFFEDKQMDTLDQQPKPFPSI